MVQSWKPEVAEAVEAKALLLQEKAMANQKVQAMVKDPVEEQPQVSDSTEKKL